MKHQASVERYIAAMVEWWMDEDEINDFHRYMFKTHGETLNQLIEDEIMEPYPLDS